MIAMHTASASERPCLFPLLPTGPVNSRWMEQAGPKERRDVHRKLNFMVLLGWSQTGQNVGSLCRGNVTGETLVIHVAVVAFPLHKWMTLCLFGKLRHS